MSDALTMYVIYRCPADYPDRYVVRRFRVVANEPVPDADPVGFAFNIFEARKLVPAGLVRVARDPNDEPQIMETWF